MTEKTSLVAPSIADDESCEVKVDAKIKIIDDVDMLKTPVYQKKVERVKNESLLDACL